MLREVFYRKILLSLRSAQAIDEINDYNRFVHYEFQHVLRIDRQKSIRPSDRR